MVDRLQSLSWPNLQLLAERYAGLDETAAPTAHRAFQTLLERTTRAVLLPAAVRRTSGRAASGPSAPAD